jgi:nicotinate phosphoribosyltransferase
MRETPHRGFFVAAGLAPALDWLEQLSFGDAELEWMRRSGLFSGDFIDSMADFEFTGNVNALPEGTVFFPEEPLVQIIAPLPQAQLIESRLMNILHYHTLIATKAARCVQVADGTPVIDFGLRRAHGGEAGLWAARACHLAGFAATATCLGSARYGIPPTGTMAHAFILAHDREVEAFEHFARSHPDNVVLLIDTYDVRRGAERVVEVARRLAADRIPIHGVRIDSGELASNARMVRGILDAGGLHDTRILVSGGLDEYQLETLLKEGAPIDGVGVGSNVNTSADLPFLDSAYKLHDFRGMARGKRALGKTDLPGRKQVFRRFDDHGVMCEDTLGLMGEDVPGEALLEAVMVSGARVAGRDGSLAGARHHCSTQLDALPGGVGRLRDPDHYPVSLSTGLSSLHRDGLSDG